MVGKIDNIDAVKGDYYVYGFIPRDAARDAELALLSGESTYEKGAVLTIRGLSPVTPTDVCAIIGAREGFMVKDGEDDIYYDGKYTDTNSNGAYDAGTDTRHDRLRPGCFDFEIKSGNNYLFLLFDHLYTALRFRFKLGTVYHGLRDVVLKKVELKATGVKASYDATITLRANDSETMPIEGNVTFTPVGETVMDYVTIFDGKGLADTETGYVIDGLKLKAGDTDGAYTSFMGGFVPDDSHRTFTLRSTYDVYDKKGNLVRKNCTAENELKDVQTILDAPVVLERGMYYSINLSVEPTFLYMLSEPDLNDPTVVVE